MAPIQYGRTRPDLSGASEEFAVFLIGARINKPWRVHQWWPVLKAMPRMLRELEQHPDLGFLGFEQWLSRTTVLVQYWRSMSHLMRYAHSKEHEHLPAWREFHRRARTDAVGVWHEAYVVRPAEVHATYVNMPRFGLARVAEALGAGAGAGAGQRRQIAPGSAA